MRERERDRGTGMEGIGSCDCRGLQAQNVQSRLETKGRADVAAQVQRQSGGT